MLILQRLNADILVKNNKNFSKLNSIMKKLMIACALMLSAIAFTACNGEGCYKITMKTGEQSNVVYVYGNSEDIDVVVDKAKAAADLLGVKFSAHRQKVNKSQSDCHN